MFDCGFLHPTKLQLTTCAVPSCDSKCSDRLADRTRLTYEFVLYLDTAVVQRRSLGNFELATLLGESSKEAISKQRSAIWPALPRVMVRVFMLESVDDGVDCSADSVQNR